MKMKMYNSGESAGESLPGCLHHRDESDLYNLYSFSVLNCHRKSMIVKCLAF